MKKNYFYLMFIAFSFILIKPTLLNAQTDGTLTVTFTQVAHSGYWGAKHVLAVWIQDNSDAFVKTKMRYWSSETNDHLPNWVANSGQNTVDATTGATLTSYTQRSFTWNAKDINEALVADGDYKITLEETWSHGSGNTTLVSYNFTKNGTESHLTPADNSDFTDVFIDWVPLSSGVSTIENNNLVSIFPNPTKGNIKLNFNKNNKVSRLVIFNSLGMIVHQEASNNFSGQKTIDLSSLDNGIYFVEIFSNNEIIQKNKIILNK